MKEEWKPVKGYEGIYAVSNYGNVYSIRSERILIPIKTRAGYLRVHLSVGGDCKSRFVHRLVAQAFIPNPDGKPTVNHSDGNKFNNCIDNLVWATHKENNEHAYNSGLKRLGENNAQAKLTNEQAREVLENCILGDINFGAKAFAKKFGVTQRVILNII